MANNTKTINTRIALRTGDYTYWTTGAGKDIELFKGEVCICTIAVADNQAQTAPTVLFKVCDTTGKKFGDLKWTSALAADVYDWAKAANVEFQNQHILFKNATGGIIKDLDLSVFVTTDELATELAKYYTKTEIDNLFGNVVNTVTTVAEETGINVTDAGTAGNHAYTVALDVEGAKTALGLKSAAYETVNNLNATAKGYADAVEAKLPTSADYGILEVKGDTTSGVVVDNTDAQRPIVKIAANTYDAHGAAAEVLGSSNDTATANTVYGAKAAAAAAQSDATIAKTKIETFLGAVTPDGSQDIIDTLTEINEYVGEHGEEFATLSGKVTNIENGTTVVPKAADADTLDGHDSTHFATAESVSNISNNLGALAGKDKVAEGDIEGSIGVSKISGLGALATKDNIDHSFVSDFDTAVAAVKVTNAGNADTLGTHAPEYFATAARVKALEDAKHINKVEADTGLKIVKGSTNEDNKVAIDTDVVFVLDCNW